MNNENVRKAVALLESADFSDLDKEQRLIHQALVKGALDVLGGTTLSMYYLTDLSRASRRLDRAAEEIYYGINRDMTKTVIAGREASLENGVLDIDQQTLGEIRRSGQLIIKSKIDGGVSWIPNWVANAVMQFKSLGGFGGMELRKFIKKMAPVHMQESEPEQNKSSMPGSRYSTAKNRSAIRDRSAGKNEYVPKNRHRR